MPRGTRIARRKRRLAHALRSAARAHRYLQKTLENRDLAGGVGKVDSQMGRRPIKKAFTLPRNGLDGAELASSHARRAR